MRRIHTTKLLPLVLALGFSQPGIASEADHREFEATLHAPYSAVAAAQEGSAYDTLKLQVRNSGGTILATPLTYSNLNKGTGYVQCSVDLSAYKGQTVQIFFAGAEDSSLQTTFLVDDVALTVQ